MRYITDMSRFKTGYNGFMARITVEGKLRQKSFTKLVEAKRWINAVLHAKRKSMLLRKGCSNVLKSNNNSGRTGVRRTNSISMCNGHKYVYPVWEAYWHTFEKDSKGQHKVKRVKFSINKYGEFFAKRKAIGARRKAEQQLYMKKRLVK